MSPLIYVLCSLSLAYFKGKTDTGPPKKKKKCKKKHFKEKSSDEKKPNPKSQQKSSPSPAAQKGPASAKLNGSKSQNPIISTPQQPKGIFLSYCLFLLYKCVNVSYSQILSCFFLLKGANAASNFSTVDVLRKRLHAKIEESRGQVGSI